MKNKTLLLFCLLGGAITTYAQAPNWIWAQGGGSTSLDWGNSIASDPFGNVISTGYFGDSDLVFGSFILPSAGGADIYVVKYGPTGNVLWAHRAGGTGHDYGSSVATDSLGNIYLTGRFNSTTANFSGSVITNSDSTLLYSDIFLAKYDPAGNVLWVRSAGGSMASSSARDILLDRMGNIYLTGNFAEASISFDSIVLSNPGGADLFVAKYSNGGSPIWVRNFGGSQSDRGVSLCLDIDNSAVVAGNFIDTLFALDGWTLTNTGSSDLFIAKFDSVGNVVWATATGGAYSEYMYSLCSDPSGNFFITGEFYSLSITEGSVSIFNSDSAGFTPDIFVMKFDNSGTIDWARSAGGLNLDGGSGIIADSSGHVYVAGYFEAPTIDFSGQVLTNAGPAGTDEVFVTKYTPTGAVAWAQRAGGTTHDWALDICIGPGGYMTITGIYDSPACAFGSTVLTNAGTFDVFHARLDIVTGLWQVPGLDTELYPNPADGILHVRTVLQGNVRVRLWNIAGQQVTVPPAAGDPSSMAIDISQLHPGLYTMELVSGETRLVKRFIKQ